MKKKKNTEIKIIGGFKATAKEQREIERVKKYYSRSSLADTIRFLLQRESQKILSEDIANGVK